MNKVKEFIGDNLHFYGENGLSPFNCSDEIITSVAKFYASEGEDFIGTYVDREKVRVMLGALGYTEIKNK